PVGGTAPAGTAARSGLEALVIGHVGGVDHVDGDGMILFHGLAVEMADHVIHGILDHLGRTGDGEQVEVGHDVGIGGVGVGAGQDLVHLAHAGGGADGVDGLHESVLLGLLDLGAAQSFQNAHADLVVV